VFSTKVDKKLCNIYAKIEKKTIFFQNNSILARIGVKPIKKMQASTEFSFMKRKLSFSIFRQMFLYT